MKVVQLTQHPTHNILFMDNNQGSENKLKYLLGVQSIFDWVISVYYCDIRLQINNIGFSHMEIETAKIFRTKASELPRIINSIS